MDQHVVKTMISIKKKLKNKNKPKKLALLQCLLRTSVMPGGDNHGAKRLPWVVSLMYFPKYSREDNF